MKRLRLALIGAGRAGLIHGANIARRIERAELAAVCDASPENLRTAAEELGCPRADADFRAICDAPAIDAVVIVTPTFLHAEIACAAAAAGKHVFLEKPMAITVDECRAIEEAVRDGGREAPDRLHAPIRRGFSAGEERPRLWASWAA